ncbi:hypothetical protein JTE90_002736 [Oedothorax gibbosus]|uniref:Histone H2A n=1 Tax=Oedothorax gibbosus TaxID=931172 RepID=A0AAV6VZG6_9ARAC|nr:hypothetical protein JTE90_002736 [Oedothorax gibbosus]
MSSSRRSRTTKSEMAGLRFPVSRVRAMLQAQEVAPKIYNTAAVYMTAVLEYFTAEILELSMRSAQAEDKTRIQPRHLNIAIKKDKDMRQKFVTAAVPISPYIPLEEIMENTDEPSTSGPRASSNRPYLEKKLIVRRNRGPGN